MRYYNILFPIAAAVLVWGCSATQIDEVTVDQPQATEGQIPESATVPGVMSVRVSEALAESLLEHADSKGVISAEGVALLSIPDVHITGVSTSFRIGGKFEARQKAAGLHRWFKVSYDQDMPATRASGVAAESDGIELAEPIIKIKPQAVTMDDPLYTAGYQWHYYNYGQNDFTSGIDIKLQEAWDAYGVFGSEDVIVAIVDQGVDYDHEDLAGNIWVNEQEIPGNNIDDDGNGYTDDVHGFNFVYGNQYIHPQDHGTHVAGTVAAVNNNGIGVCGVAGGRYPDQKGVRMMCLQLMEEGVGYSGDTRMAYQYAAENGAVIVQNSWGYSEPGIPLQAADKAAIDYFIEYAGIDENGNQVGPMRGGLVVFAAGNSAADTYFPAEYERVLSVAAVGPNGRYAYYTNYGEWVDICAPGGDDTVEPVSPQPLGCVESTLVDDTYGFNRGTSMACPHVSGVAALVLSTKKPEDGFTCDNLFKLLVNTADASIYQYNSNRQGMLGSGLLDASAALGMALGSPQASPLTSFEVTSDGNSLVFTASVPVNAIYYHVYYSTSQFGSSNLTDATMEEYRISSLETTADGRKTFTLGGLDFNTTYWCTVVAANVIGEDSAAATPRQIATKENRAPVITPVQEGDIVVNACGTVARTFLVEEPDGQEYTVSWHTPNNRVASFETISSTIVQLTINALRAEAGNYTCSLTVTDSYGLATTLEIPYTVLANNEPTFLGSKDICLSGVGDTYTFNPYDWFYDADADVLTFDYNLTNPNVVSVDPQANGLVRLTALGTGSVRIAITASDARNAGVSGGVTVVVRSSNSPMDIYPNPAWSTVKVRTRESGLYKVTVSSTSGSTVYSTSASISLSSPIEIDVAGFAPGTYDVTVNDGEGKSWTGSFVKI